MAPFNELVKVASSIMQTGFYTSHRKEIEESRPINLLQSSKGYRGLISTPELVAMAQLNRTFNYRSSGVSYLRMHPSYIPFTAKDRQFNKKLVADSQVTAGLTTICEVLDGPLLCLTHSEEMHLATSSIQTLLDDSHQFGTVFSRMREAVSDTNPMGSVHPLTAMARRCLSYVPTSPIVVLMDLSFILELCRIWEYSIQDIAARISHAVDCKSEDIGFNVRATCQGVVRHKPKMEFNRALYLRKMTTVYVPFPGILVCCMGFPAVKTEMLHREILPETMFAWSASQFSAYDTSEKIQEFRKDCANFPAAASL